MEQQIVCLSAIDGDKPGKRIGTLWTRTRSPERFLLEVGRNFGKNSINRLNGQYISSHLGGMMLIVEWVTVRQIGIERQ